MPIFNTLPLPSHNFIVEIAMMKVPFSKIQGIEMALDTEALIEGGENRYVHSLTKPGNTEKILLMERVVMQNSTTQLPLRVGNIFPTIVIFVLDQNRQRRKMYTASYVVLKKRSFSELDAMGGDVFVENLEFIYRELTEVLIPSV